MAHIKLFTLNVWSGFRYHGLIRLEEYETKQVREKRFHGLCAVLRKERPDIVCLNEANPLFSYGKRLAEELGYVPLGHMGVAGLRAGTWLPIESARGRPGSCQPLPFPPIYWENAFRRKGLLRQFFLLPFRQSDTGGACALHAARGAAALCLRHALGRGTSGHG